MTTLRLKRVNLLKVVLVAAVLLAACLLALVGPVKQAASSQEAASSQLSITDLGTLPGGNESGAYSINSRGQVVGTSTTASGRYHAFLWEDGQMRDLETRPGRV